MRSNSDAVKKNLTERFNIFINDGTFREDVIGRAIQYIEQIKPTEISSYIISKYGEAWFTNFKSEYKVTDFDLLITQAYNTFIQSCIYEFTDRVSDITSSKYGKVKGIQQPLSLTLSDIKKRINILLVQSLNKYIAIPDVRTTISDVQTIESRDEIFRVLQKKESDLVIDTTLPVREVIQVKKTVVADKEIVFNKKVKEQAQIPRPTELPPTPIFDERVNIKNEIVVDGKTFEITPLPVELAGGSPISGEGAQGNQPIGNRTSNSQPLGSGEFSNPQDAIEKEYLFRTKNLTRER
jgi:N-glycosylase/DNA lyase